MDVINNLFDKCGVYFFFGLLALNLAVLGWVFILRRNFKKIFGGAPTGGVDLERVLLELRENQNFLRAFNFFLFMLDLIYEKRTNFF